VTSKEAAAFFLLPRYVEKAIPIIDYCESVIANKLTNRTGKELSNETPTLLNLGHCSAQL